MPIEEEVGKGKRSPRRGAEGKRGAGGAGRLAGLFGSDAPSDEMEWGSVDARFIAWVTVNVTILGGAVTFGRSRDRGALMVTLLLDGDRSTRWISPRDVPEDVLTEIAERLDTLRV